MATHRVTRAQRGKPLADVLAGRRAKRLSGPFLSPGALRPDERRRLIDGVERLVESFYAHLPLKRARYGLDPVQRLRILRSQSDELGPFAFHLELFDTLRRLRDAHTSYDGPRDLESKAAVLPFLVEAYGPDGAPVYVVTKIAGRLARGFAPGAELTYWNGVPIDLAVQRHGDRGFGGRPDTRRASALETLTLRPLRYNAPPDEHWVVIRYRPATARGGVAAREEEIRIPWRIVDPGVIDSRLQQTLAERSRGQARRRALAVSPAAETMRRAKMLLFAPHALTGKPARRRRQRPRPGALPLRVIPTRLPDVLRATRIDAPGGPFGHLRIFGFDSTEGPFVRELRRLIPLLPKRGLILDVRGNPGGYVAAAEQALQLFTPNRIEPTRFAPLATPFTLRNASRPLLEIQAWRRSLAAAVRNGDAYGQPLPLTPPADCNAIGQLYGGPVVLVADASTYSAGDLFSAGFVDNEMGPFLCVGEATGAGGASVWTYGELRSGLAGSRDPLPALPEGIDLSFSFLRATRARASEGVPIEDVGVVGESVALTRADLLHDNQDLLRRCTQVLRSLPYSELEHTVRRGKRPQVTVATRGLGRVDVICDGRPTATVAVADGARVDIEIPARTRVVELVGLARDVARQRRRIRLRR